MPFLIGGLSTASIVHVFVLDINDNRPNFSPHEYNVTLRIDGPTSGPILKVVASDIDAGIFGQINYRISGGNGAEIFSIDRTSGEIYIVRVNQLTESSTYLLNVTASDGAGLQSIKDAIVRLWITSPSQGTASCGRPKYSITIKENVVQNTFLGSVQNSNIVSDNGEFIDFSSLFAFLFIFYENTVFNDTFSMKYLCGCGSFIAQENRG